MEVAGFISFSFIDSHRDDLLLMADLHSFLWLHLPTLPCPTDYYLPYTLAARATPLVPREYNTTLHGRLLLLKLHVG